MPFHVKQGRGGNGDTTACRIVQCHQAQGTQKSADFLASVVISFLELPFFLYFCKLVLRLSKHGISCHNILTMNTKEQKIILITGASSGFGKATAELLAAKGHIVYGTSRKAQCSSEASQTAGATTAVHFLQMDVREPKSIQHGVLQIMQEQKHLDVVINNAGMGIGGSVELATEEEIRLQMETNFMGCVNVCQQVLPIMRKQRRGRIINLSSIGGVMGLPYQGFYSASKFAIEGFSEALAAEVKGFGISVSMIEPGDFATGFTASRKNSVATAESDDYGLSFRRSLALIEKEENGGLKPEVLARKIAQVAVCRHPRLRYCVADLEQRFSMFVKKILPGNWFVNILRNYYKV